MKDIFCENIKECDLIIKILKLNLNHENDILTANYPIILFKSSFGLRKWFILGNIKPEDINFEEKILAKEIIRKEKMKRII